MTAMTMMMMTVTMMMMMMIIIIIMMMMMMKKMKMTITNHFQPESFETCPSGENILLGTMNREKEQDTATAEISYIEGTSGAGQKTPEIFVYRSSNEK